MAAEPNYPPTSETNEGGGSPLEKDFSTNHHLDNGMHTEQALHRIRTAGSISISPELFEKIYLSPQNRVSGELRKTFGNPTPLALCGFLLSLTPLSCDLMGWRGAGTTGGGAANTGAFFGFGGMLMIVGAVGEWIIGNTFPFVVFGSFGGFWLAFGMTLQPFYNSYGAYSTDPTNPAAGLQEPSFNASFAFFCLWMGLLCFIYMILALRTNITFFLIFFTLVLTFACLAGAYWENANGNIALAGRLQVAGGACAFVTCCCGWWIFFAIMLASLDFPFQLPVGDLSHIIKGASDKRKARDEAV